MSINPTEKTTLADDPQYKELCKTLSMFCMAKELDKRSRDQLASMISIALHIGSNHHNDPKPS